MADPIYDTHNFVKRLNEVGIPEKQAEVLAAENMHIMTQVLATKDDLQALETRLDRRFAELKAEFAELKAEFAENRADTKIEMANLCVHLANLNNRVDTLENRLLIRLGGLVIAVQAAALVIGRLF